MTTRLTANSPNTIRASRQLKSSIPAPYATAVIELIATPATKDPTTPAMLVLLAIRIATSE